MSIPDLLKEAESCLASNPRKAEHLYKQILNTAGVSGATSHGSVAFILQQTASPGEVERLSDSEKTTILHNQETALVKLGELYRDQKSVCSLSGRVTI